MNKNQPEYPSQNIGNVSVNHKDEELGRRAALAKKFFEKYNYSYRGKHTSE
jgi:hypothetical protein